MKNPRLGNRVFDSRTRIAGTFCGWTAQGRAKILRDGKLRYVRAEFVKRANRDLWVR